MFMPMAGCETGDLRASSSVFLIGFARFAIWSSVRNIMIRSKAWWKIPTKERVMVPRCVKIVWHICMSPCMSSLSQNYIAAACLNFAHLFIYLVCALYMSFFPKLLFSHSKSSFHFFPLIFHPLFKRVHPHPTLIMPYIFNKLSYPFITLNSFHFQSQLCHCNIGSVIAKHLSYLKWYVIKFLAIHNSLLTWVLLS